MSKELNEEIILQKKQVFSSNCKVNLIAACTPENGILVLDDIQKSKAIQEFELLKNKYPASNYLDNSMYYLIRAYTDNSDCTNADKEWARFQTQFPLSPDLTTAQTYKVSGGCP